MDTPINVSYRWSADEMLLLNRLHMQSSPQGRKAQRSFRSTGVILLCLGIVALCSVGLTPQKLRASLFGVGFLLGAAALLVGMPRLMRNAVLKMYAKKPDRDLVISYQLSEESLSCKSDIASSEMLWRNILKVLRTKAGFLLYVSDNQIHWLPIHGFQNAADVGRFADISRGKAPEYKDER